nr:hypothetical protein [Spirochaetota bacterium]
NPILGIGKTANISRSFFSRPACRFHGGFFFNGNRTPADTIDEGNQRIPKEGAMWYRMSEEYEIIPKHCPRCEALVMAAVVRTSGGEFYKYRETRCSQCDWVNGA